MFIAIAFIGAVALVGEHAEGADVYIPGDWVIDTDMAFDGDTITVRGSTAIRDGGSLTLNNCTLLIDSRGDDAFNRVLDGRYDVSVRATDRAGNVNVLTAKDEQHGGAGSP